MRPRSMTWSRGSVEAAVWEKPARGDGEVEIHFAADGAAVCAGGGRGRW